MNKKLTILAVSVVTLCLIFVPMGLAKKDKGKTGQAGKSNVGQLYLVEKDPGTWEIISDGAWGKMTYKIIKGQFHFIFNGHGLEAAWDYTLIYYPDPWPGSGLVCLGNAIADPTGNVHIKASVPQNFPYCDDPNLQGTEYTGPGYKIWLVLTSNIVCGDKMVGWTPAEYLFEFDVIPYDTEKDTCIER